MSQPASEFFKDAVFLIDASSYIFRAYYAIQVPLKAPDGTPTHATYGFLQMVQSLDREFKNPRIVLVWDRPEKGFRHETFSAYKANRSAPPDDLGIQIQNVRKGSELFGFPQLDAKGFEADDIIATLVAKHPSQNFAIVTADKDLLQLVGPHVWCLDTFKRRWSNADEAVEKFGVPPSLIRDVQALCGDSVDNVPGAPGVGPKTATELINHFKSLDAVLTEAAKRWKDPSLQTKNDPLKGKRLESIATHIDQVKTSLELVSLRADVPIDFPVESFSRVKIDNEKLLLWAKSMGFTKLVATLSSVPADQDAIKNAHLSAPTESGEKAREPQQLDFKVTSVNSLSQLEDIFKFHSTATEMALDTETFGLESRKLANIVGLSFSFDASEGFYVPLRHIEGDNLDPAQAIAILQSYLATRGSNFRVIFQNAKFDLHVLHASGLSWPDALRVDDTMVQSFVLDPNEAHGMDALSVKYLGYEPKSFDAVLGENENFSEVSINNAASYSGEDAVVTLLLFKELSEKLKSEGLWKVYDIIDRPLIPVLTEMERAGVYLDPNPLSELSRQLKEELATKEIAAKELLTDYGVEVSEDLNLGSPKQMAEILYEKLKLPILKRGKTGPSTDVKVLEELSTQHPFPAALVDIRELSKLLSTYVDALPLLVDPKTARVHTDFSQVIAATGRLSSSKPNLQNIPIRTERGRKIREAFRASPGHLLVGIDYSQVELRLLAHISQDKELLRAFREGADIHKRTAALILKKPESEVNDDDRRMAKTINFGIVYGQTSFGLSKTLGIPKAEAQRFIEDYFKTYPGIRDYMDKAIDEAKKTGQVTTLTKRRRPLPEIHSKNGALRQFGERMAINSPIQGTAADLMKAGMIAAFSEVKLRYPSAALVLQVHDELIFEVDPSQADELRLFVTEILEDPKLLKDFGVENFSIPMKTESATGEHWGQI